MAYIIEQFMWGYQQHFQISLKVFAERLFEKIDPSLKPKVFLIGILNKDLENRHEVCLEPEDCGYSQEAFANVKELATQLEAVDAETRIIHSHPIAQENHDFINDRGFFHHIDPRDREKVAMKIDNVLKINGYYYLRCWSDKEEESDRGPYRISKDEIKNTFSKFFKIGEIKDFRFGGKGARGYACLMRKEVHK